MEPQYLIDSNAVIDYLSGRIPPKGLPFMNEVINSTPNISVITKIEVLGYKTSSGAYHLLSDFIEDSIVLGLSDDVVKKTIEIRKENKTKTPDAIIAATAITNQMTLITRNTKDFDKIEGLNIVNLYDL